MSAKLARGSSSGGRGKARAPARGTARKRQGTMSETLPLAPHTVRQVSSWLLGAMLLAFLLAVLVAFRVPQMAGIAIGESVGHAGFTVRRIEPKGLNRLPAMEVYKAAQGQMGVAMPLVDLEGTREQLLRFGWVKDARVSRRFPDTLLVDVVERSPAAIWQYQQHLSLIDRDGVVLQPVDLSAMPDLPLVIGPAANQHASELNALLNAAPELKNLLAGATWVGGRRWDLRFHSGETLALPEGPDNAARALAYFAKTDHESQLLGRGLVRFDLRIPGKMIVRVSREPGSIVPAQPAPAQTAPAPTAPPPSAGQASPTAETI
jgi:cell division protein FtsQ